MLKCLSRLLPPALTTTLASLSTSISAEVILDFSVAPCLLSDSFYLVQGPLHHVVEGLDLRLLLLSMGPTATSLLSLLPPPHRSPLCSVTASRIMTLLSLCSGLLVFRLSAVPPLLMVHLPQSSSCADSRSTANNREHWLWGGFEVPLLPFFLSAYPRCSEIT